MNLQFNEEVLHPRTAEQHPAKKKGIKEFFSPDFGIVHTHTPSNQSFATQYTIRIQIVSELYSMRLSFFHFPFNDLCRFHSKNQKKKNIAFCIQRDLDM